MMPATVPAVTVYAGDTCQFDKYTITSGGVFLNLVAAGWTLWTAQWRSSAVSSFSLPLSVNTDYASTGIITVSATPAQTALMAVNGVWDLQATHTSGVVQTFLRGTTTYVQDVTRG